MQKNRKTLAFAESCTGGYLATQVTKYPGASDYFLGSLVTYSNALKQKILGVKGATLKKHGAVSPEVVVEMWQGLMKRTGADFGIAVSGIAGPTGGTKDKPVGTVWYAIGQKGQQPEVGSFLIKGSRKMIMVKAANKLFGKLRFL
jgi:nicotinamide-nucleotide amidase